MPYPLVQGIEQGAQQRRRIKRIREMLMHAGVRLALRRRKVLGTGKQIEPCPGVLGKVNAKSVCMHE